ncbi:hypothetical protein Droror1_Dr00020775 [Drosera rotundifolia]
MCFMKGGLVRRVIRTGYLVVMGAATLIQTEGIRELSVRSEPLNGSSSDEGEPRSSPDALVFQYLEYAPLYSRVPFSDKMSALASGFPDLKAYRSCDLSPASWVSQDASIFHCASILETNDWMFAIGGITGASHGITSPCESLSIVGVGC